MDMGLIRVYRESFYWYKKAALRGDAEAQYCVGVMYYNGRGVNQNYEQAFYWLGLAIGQGHENAQIALNEIIDSLNRRLYY